MSDFYRDPSDRSDVYGAQNEQNNGAWYPDPRTDGYDQEGYYDAESAPSDAYSSQAEQRQAGEGDPYTAWRRPHAGRQGESFLDEAPAPFGAELQQGGVPLSDFRAMGDNAPTRIATPVQMVKRRTTVSEAQGATFVRPEAMQAAERRAVEPAARQGEAESAPATETPAGQAPVRRRRSRVERHAAEDAQLQQAAPEAAAPAVSDFDPFGAGDSEVPAADGRRAAVPGGRYTGPRTAVPSAVAQESSVADKARAVRDERMEERAAQAPRRPMPQAANQPANRPARPPMANEENPPLRRPMPGQGDGAPVRRPMPQQGENAPMRRPMPQNGDNAPLRRPMPQQGDNAPMRRPMPQQGDNAPMRRPMPQQGDNAPLRRPMPQNGEAAPLRRPAAQTRQLSPDDAYARKQATADSPYAYRAQGKPGYDDQRSPVSRKPYDFEKQEEEKPRRRSALLPIVVVLLVLGGLLAGLCLPDWQGMNNQVGAVVAPVKEKVVSAFISVKNMILPEEEPIKSFTASTSDTAAPATLRLTVQTAKSVKGIRVTDDNGNTVYNGSYDAMSGTVIENSNALIWTPSCVVEQAYIGGFTVYAQKANGTESEGLRTENTVNIAQPKPVLPPLQSFTCDTEEATIPAQVGFTVVTSSEVTAVRVVDQYSSPVAAMMVDDGDSDTGTMTESGDTRTWTLTAAITAPITGSYAVQYQTENDNLNYTDGGYSVFVKLSAPEANAGAADSVPAMTEATAEPQATQAPATDAPATDAPTATPAPTPAPTATPVPAMTQPAPENTPLPAAISKAGDAADPNSDDMKLKPTVYIGEKTAETYTRTNKIAMLNPFTTAAGLNDYAIWKQAGVLTFRSGPMRQNAAYGVADVQSGKLTELWSQPVGSMKLSNDVLYGVNAPGQPVIVKWPTEVRQRMGLNDEARDVTALKEVIVAAQDGKIYFFNLLDGTATREAFDLGAPSAGGLSVATNGTPILGVGQSHSKLAGKTVKSGYHIINLLNNKEALLVSTDGKEKNSNYSGVLGAALFDSKTGTMIFGSQGGVLYTAELGRQTQTYDYQAGKVDLSSSVQAYKALAKGQDKKTTNIDASIAMYNNYVYYGDQEGIMQCVDVNAMKPVWAVRLGDNIDATPALDAAEDGAVSLFTGNTILNQRKGGVCTLYRLNALTGDTDWSYAVPDVTYQSEYEVGLEGSPVLGEKNIDDLVIFTVTNGGNGSKTLALDKKTGELKWQADYAAETLSSPVAVYNQNGDAWIVQALSDGSIHLLSGETGEVLDTLKLDTQIKASPAAYGNLLVIGTTGKANSAVYCIKID